MYDVRITFSLCACGLTPRPQTNNLDDTYCCTTPAEQQYVEQFQTATLQLFTQLPSTAVIFSSACLVHVRE